MEQMLSGTKFHVAASHADLPKHAMQYFRRNVTLQTRPKIRHDTALQTKIPA